MGATEPQDGPGGLFDDESDLFDRKEQAAVAYGHAPARRTAKNFQEARAAAKEFQGKTLVNRDSGIEAVVSRNSLDKMFSGLAVGKSSSAPAHKLAVANVDSLYENAVHGWSKPDKRGEATVVAVHRMFSRMDTKEGPASFVKMTIKETRSETQNNPLYSLEAVEFLPEGVPAATWVNEAMTADGVSPRSTLSAGTLSNIAISVQTDNAGPEIPQELFTKLKTRLKKVGLGHVSLEQDQSMDAQGAFESDAMRNMRIIVGKTEDGEHTVNHEVVHAIKAMGLFKDKEWAALEAEARRVNR